MTHAHRLTTYAVSPMGSFSEQRDSPRKPSPHAGKPCCGFKADGTLCGARISPHNGLKTRFPFCCPCHQELINNGMGTTVPRFRCCAFTERGLLCGARLTSANVEPGKIPLCASCAKRFAEMGIRPQFPRILEPLLR